LVKERSDLRIDRVIGSAPEPAFLGVVDELPIEGFRLEETVPRGPWSWPILSTM
jgi:hypothetical protein